MKTKLDPCVLSLGAIAILLCCAPFLLSKSGLVLATEFCAVLAMALSWNLLAGFSGLVIIGMPLFIAVGGYALFTLANALGIPPYPVVPVGGLAAALLAYLLAPLLFRLQGAQLAIGSWVVAEIARILVLLSPSLGAGGGLNLAVVKMVARSWRIPLNFLTVAFVLLITLVAVVVLLRSRFGLALRALRDSESAAAAVGVETGKVKLWTFVLAAGLSGAAGAAFYINALQITPGSSFSQNWIAMIAFIVILGGIGSVEGPIFGAIVYFLLRESLAGLGTIYFVITGLLAIGVTILLPGGIWGLVRDTIKFDFLPVRAKAEVTRTFKTAQHEQKTA